MENICTGSLSKLQMKSVNDILSRELSCKADPISIQQRMDRHYEDEMATVTNKYTGQNLVLSERRTSSKYTFDSKVVKSLWKIFSNPITDKLKQICNLVDIKPELSHGDIVFYREGGYFKWHRDTAGECPYDFIKGIKPVNFSFLMGLITCKDGGETSIVFNDSKIHTFNQSKTASQFILFDSDKLHSGERVNKGFKMILKLEFWIWFTKMTSHCTCRKCEVPTVIGKKKQHKINRLRKLKYGDLYCEYLSERTVSKKKCLICNQEDIIRFCERCPNGICHECYDRVDMCPFCRFPYTKKGSLRDINKEDEEYNDTNNDYYYQEDDADDWSCNGLWCYN